MIFRGFRELHRLKSLKLNPHPLATNARRMGHPAPSFPGCPVLVSPVCGETRTGVFPERMLELRFFYSRGQDLLDINEVGRIFSGVAGDAVRGLLAVVARFFHSL